MGATIELPMWLAAVAGMLAAVALLDRLLVPGTRWLLRRRLNRVIDELNTRLKLRLPPFKLTRRQILIDRLTWDPQVLEAAEAQADAAGVPREAVMAEVRRFAREIVPAFNAYLYFRVGYWLAKRVARALYRVRLGYADEAALARIDPRATVVFVMNHRSNMDYLLVGYLAADQTALSYAVGEWAKVWPLQQLIRAMGAYFIRRNSGDPLYRRVLERYVHMATEAGVTQAVYPEGGLSRDGRLRAPKLGLLDYMVKSFDPYGPRDIVFVPVALNYDRVLEDRTLLRSLDRAAPRRGAGFALRTTLGFIVRNVRQMFGRRWYRFGYACANFGSPLSLRAWLAERAVDLRRLPKDARFAEVEPLAQELMRRVAAAMPVLPVSLIAALFVREPGRRYSELELKAAAHALMRRLELDRAHVYIPRADQDYAIAVGLRMLTLRRLVETADGLYAAHAPELPVLRYYANAIDHLLRADPPNG